MILYSMVYRYEREQSTIYKIFVYIVLYGIVRNNTNKILHKILHKSARSIFRGNKNFLPHWINHTFKIYYFFSYNIPEISLSKKYCILLSMAQQQPEGLIEVLVIIYIPYDTNDTNNQWKYHSPTFLICLYPDWRQDVLIIDSQGRNRHHHLGRLLPLSLCSTS